MGDKTTCSETSVYTCIEYKVIDLSRCFSSNTLVFSCSLAKDLLLFPDDLIPEPLILLSLISCRSPSWNNAKRVANKKEFGSYPGIFGTEVPMLSCVKTITVVFFFWFRGSLREKVITENVKNESIWLPFSLLIKKVNNIYIYILQ